MSPLGRLTRSVDGEGGRRLPVGRASPLRTRWCPPSETGDTGPNRCTPGEYFWERPSVLRPDAPSFWGKAPKDLTATRTHVFGQDTRLNVSRWCSVHDRARSPVRGPGRSVPSELTPTKPQLRGVDVPPGSELTATL